MSKLYNGKEHIFTSLGVTTNIILKGGPGEQFQIQGTLNVVDGPNNPASLLVNGNGVGSVVSLANLTDVNLTSPVLGNVLEYNGTDWINSNGKLLFNENESLSIAKNYISYGTQYINYTGTSISFGTDTNFSTGRISFNYGKTLNVTGDSYINQNVSTSGTPYVTRLGIGQSADSTIPLKVTGSGSSSSATSNLALFDSGSVTAGNLYSVCVNKSGTESALLGINKNSTTGSIVSNSVFLSTFNKAGTLTIGRGADNNLPNYNDIVVTSTGISLNNVVTSGPIFSTGSIISNSGNVSAASGDLTASRLAGNQTLCRLTVGSNFWDLQHNSNNNFQIDYNDNICISINKNGYINFPLNTRFQCYPSGNINIPYDSDYDLVFNTTAFNSGEYNTSTGTYTAPVSGVYQFSGMLTLIDVNTSDEYIYLRLITTTQEYILIQKNGFIGTSETIPFNQICYLNSGNTAKLTIYRYSQDNIHVPYIYGALKNSNFSGLLIG